MARYIRRKKPVQEKARLWAIRFLINRDGGNCYLCHKTFESKKDITIDHLIAKSKGGTSEPSNLRLAHEKCNGAKKNMSLEEYAILQEGF